MNAFLDPKNMDAVNSARSSNVGASESENLIQNNQKYETSVTQRPKIEIK